MIAVVRFLAAIPLSPLSTLSSPPTAPPFAPSLLMSRARAARHGSAITAPEDMSKKHIGSAKSRPRGRPNRERRGMLRSPSKVWRLKHLHRKFGPGFTRACPSKSFSTFAIIYGIFNCISNGIASPAGELASALSSGKIFLTRNRSTRAISARPSATVRSGHRGVPFGVSIPIRIP